MKTVNINGIQIQMEQKGYGQYTLRATIDGQALSAHCTDSEVWDWIDDEENEAKHEAAKATALRLLEAVMD